MISPRGVPASQIQVPSTQSPGQDNRKASTRHRPTARVGDPPRAHVPGELSSLSIQSSADWIALALLSWGFPQQPTQSVAWPNSRSLLWTRTMPCESWGQSLGTALWSGWSFPCGRGNRRRAEPIVSQPKQLEVTAAVRLGSCKPNTEFTKQVPAMRLCSRHCLGGLPPYGVLWSQGHGHRPRSRGVPPGDG